MLQTKELLGTSNQNLQDFLIETLSRELLAGADKYKDPDIVRWIHNHFRIPETDDHIMLLEPYQERVLREVLTRDENGNFPYSLVVWGDIKKSIKSCIASAVVLWRAWGIDWGTIRIIANDLKQADSRIMYYARRSVELNQEMRQYVDIKPSGYEMNFPNKTYVQAVPIDPAGEAGGGDDMVAYSELWGFKSKAQIKMWTESTLSPTKYGKSFRWVETYAGFEGESPVLEQIYRRMKKEGEVPEWANEFDPPLQVYIDRPSRTLMMWNQVPRMPWQTPGYYAQEAAALPETEFNRVHRNMWGASTEAFVPYEWWQALKSSAPEPDIDKSRPCIVTADAATTNDCFGVMLLTGTEFEKVYSPRIARAWNPKQIDKKLFKEIKDYIYWLLDNFHVIEFTYDPYQMAQLAEEIKYERATNVYAFQQGKERAIADKKLFDYIRNGQLIHYGIPVLDDHIKNANRVPEEETKMRIVKRNPEDKIDLAVCLSMGVDRAEHWDI